MRLPGFLRPRLNSPLGLTWLASLWMGLVCNWPLWQRMLDLPELGDAAGRLFVLVFAGMVVSLTAGLLSLLCWRGLIKPVLALCLLTAAALTHFMSSYGIVVDPTMIVNVLHTDARETRDLLSLRLFATLALLGGLPIWWLWRRPLAHRSLLPSLGLNLLSLLLGLVLAVALAMSSFAELASTMRNYKELRYMINPMTAFWSLGVVAVESQQAPHGPAQVLGADARLAPRAAGSKPPLFMLVVGETARAANFSLNGYGRNTNPELAKLDVLSFRAASACGTSTAASLPCMFSPLGREAFGGQKGAQENLLDVLQRAGLAVLWLDNQSGCKGLCERIPNSMAGTPAAGAGPIPDGLCDGEECLDAALLHGLDQRIAALDPARVARGVVLVLHQMGSHGPAYFKRSPAAAKPFLPECRSNALQQCPREQVLNAYDNTIAYTDHVLAGLIAWLKTQQARFDTSLLYVSDHGESLGENKLYLHGMPYAVAPQEQKRVPLILWLPEPSAQAAGVSRACLSQRLDQPLSHDHLFHTTLGLMGVQTQVRRADWDLLAPCHQP